MVSPCELAVVGRLVDFCRISMGLLNTSSLVQDKSQSDWEVEDKGGEIGVGELDNVKVEDRFSRGRMLIPDVMMCVEESVWREWKGYTESRRSKDENPGNLGISKWRRNLLEAEWLLK